MIQKTFLLLFLMYCGIHFSQEADLSSYKYIIVPEKFDFLKENDQYQTSSITKFLLQKKGFKVFIENETLPSEVIENRCLALTAKVLDKSNMLTIKSVIELIDCFGKTIYTSKVGKTKIKDYKRGYQEAIRQAFETMTGLRYSYMPKKEVVEDKVIKESVTKKDAIKIDIKPENPTKKIIPTNPILKSDGFPLLYAQKTNNGFQLVNLKPELVFNLLKTSKENTYILKSKNGIIFKSGLFWIAEYYKADKIVQEKYQIKF